jgi:hypothetical protein
LEPYGLYIVLGLSIAQLLGPILFPLYKIVFSALRALVGI